MYRITVIKGEIVQAVYYNPSPEQGEANARLQHGSHCRYIVEPVEYDY